MVYRDPTGDSSLIIDYKGDSILYVPWSGGGRTVAPLKDKK